MTTNPTSIEPPDLILRLISDFGYLPEGARLVAEKLSACTSEIQAAFKRWWADGSMPTLEVEGYTVERLIEEHGMNPIAALLTLDWLIREPEQAKASLVRGHDRIR